MKKFCFACGKEIKGKAYLADCQDDQKGVEVGPDCFRHIQEQAAYSANLGIENPGYMPRSGGPSLFPSKARK